MTREELVKQKAHSLGQRYFPDANNVWARANFEAQWVSKACEEIAEWEHKRLVDKACEWLEQHVNDDKYYSCIGEEILIPYLIEDFRKAVEE